MISRYSYYVPAQRLYKGDVDLEELLVGHYLRHLPADETPKPTDGCSYWEADGLPVLRVTRNRKCIDIQVRIDPSGT